MTNWGTRTRQGTCREAPLNEREKKKETVSGYSNSSTDEKQWQSIFAARCRWSVQSPHDVIANTPFYLFFHCWFGVLLPLFRKCEKHSELRGIAFGHWESFSLIPSSILHHFRRCLSWKECREFVWSRTFVCTLCDFGLKDKQNYFDKINFLYWMRSWIISIDWQKSMHPYLLCRTSVPY